MTIEDIKRGVIQPQPCVDCGDPDSHVHHLRYPDKIVWVCKKCHESRERIIRDVGPPTPVLGICFEGEDISPEQWRAWVNAGIVSEDYSDMAWSDHREQCLAAQPHEPQ